MKKRLLAIFMTLAMALSLLPTAAFATDGDTQEGLTLQYDDYVPLSELGAESSEEIVLLSEGEEQNSVIEVVEGDDQSYLHAVGVGSASITIGEQSISVKVDPAELNIVLVSGQSNADGTHGSMDQKPIYPDTGYGYVWNGSKLISFEEKISQVEEGVSVGWYPALAAEWYALTGEKTVVIHQCASGQEIGVWAGYETGDVTDYTSKIVSTVKSCVTAIQENENYKIARTGYYWLQGETDAFIDDNTENTTYTTAKMYETAYLGMHNAFVDALAVDSAPNPYGAILSCRTRTNQPYKNIEYCGMRVAQQYLANNNSDIYMASVVMEDWTSASDSVDYYALSRDYEVDKVAVSQLINSIHYNQSAYNIMGLDAADNMYNALIEGDDISDIQLFGQDGYTQYEEGDAIVVEDNLRTVGTLNASDEDKAQLVARPVPISAECSKVTMTLTDSDGAVVKGVMDKYGLIDVGELKSAIATNDGAGLTLTVEADGESKSYTLTSKDFDSEDPDEPVIGGDSFHYLWDFTSESSYGNDDGSVTVSSVFDKNTMTYTGASVNYDEDGLTNTGNRWFNLAKPLTLSIDQQWAIEWQGSTSGQSVLIASNDAEQDKGTKKAGPYIYIYNDNESKDGFDFATDKGHSLALRSKDLSSVAQFGSIPGSARQDQDAVWTLSNNGAGELTLTIEGSGGESYQQTVAITDNTLSELTFNGVLGNFNGNLCYTGTIAYLEIYTPDRAGEVALTGIEITTPPDQIIYEDGESFNEDGMVVTAYYSDGRSKEVTDYSVDPETISEDTTEVTISYSDAYRTVATTQTVSVWSREPVTTANSYHWNFSRAAEDGLTSETDGSFDANKLNYVGTLPDMSGGTFVADGKGYFTAATSITLSKDHIWTVEWQGSTTSNSVLLANNGDDVGKKAGPFAYIYKDDGESFSFSLRDEANNSIVRFSDIPEDIRGDDNAVWRLRHDGEGNLTLTIDSDTTRSAGYEVTKTDVIKDNLVFNGVLGRYLSNNSLCYKGSISYLKVWEEVVPERLDVSVPDDLKLQMGETLDRNDISVEVVYSDGTRAPVSNYEISSVSYDASGKPTFTVSAVMDGRIVSADKQVEVENTSYEWSFTNDTTIADNGTFGAATGSAENNLTYHGSDVSTTTDGLSINGTGYFTMENPITLLKDAPWTIEWKGSTTGQSVLLANNDEGDTTSPHKTGPYIYIYNDIGIELGNSVSFRRENTSAVATFTGLSDAARKDHNAVWHLIHDGHGNLKLACKSGDLTSVVELKDVIDQDYTFNSILGYFTKNNPLRYRGTLQYLKIDQTAAQVEPTEGELEVDVSGVSKRQYSIGEEPDMTGLSVTFTPTGKDAQNITNYTYTTNPAIITSKTKQITVTVSAYGKTATGIVDIKVNSADEPAYFHWAADSKGQLSSQEDDGATANTLTPSINGRYYTMDRPVNLDPDNHWRIEWTGRVRENTNGILLSSNTVTNATTALRSTPYIYIRNGGDEGQYDISIVPDGMVGRAVAQFDVEADDLTNQTTWTLDYEKGTLSLKNDKGYSRSVEVKLDPMVFNGILGYFAVGLPLYYSEGLTDLKIYEQYEGDVYRWDFDTAHVDSDGTTLKATEGGIDLSYTGTLNGTFTSEGLTNTRSLYFTMENEQSVTLPQHSPWTIEWKGTTTENSVLLANNGEYDTNSPDKEGEYIYIYNDINRDGGNRVALRTNGTTAAATFVIPDKIPQDKDVTWYLVHDGSGNLTLGWKGSDDLYYTSTANNSVKEDYTFNGVLGYFTTDNKLCYTGTIDYLEISMQAKELSNKDGMLSVDVNDVDKNYQVGEVLDLDDLKVTYTIGNTKYDVVDYKVTTNCGFLTPETTNATVTVTALGKTVTAEIKGLTVEGRDPEYFHWNGDLDNLQNASDATENNSLTRQIGYYDMDTPVYLDPDNHWRIEWTGNVTDGDNGVLLSENTDFSNRITPYVYIRNGGDGGEYDISLIYHGYATVSDDSSSLVRFTLTGDNQSALSNPDTTWRLDYQNEELSLFCDGNLVETKSTSVPEIAFNGIGGYFTLQNSMVYRGTLTDVKIYEALYDVQVGASENGTVTVTPSADVYPGATVTLANAPDGGYQFGSYTVTDSDGNPIVVSGNSFTMPQSDVTVYATFNRTSDDDHSSSGGGSSVTRYNVTVEDTDNGSIRVSPSRASRGQTVTITVDPDEGYVLDRLIVRDSDGDRIDVEQKSSTRYTFEMPRGKVTIEATFVEGEEENVLPFRDVDTDDWSYNAVVYVTDAGIMSGVSETEFAPNATLTRAMIAQMLWALEDKPVVNYLMTYDDVAAGSWYGEAVRWISSQGFMSGYSDAAFGPNDPLTREQLCLILYNYAEWAGYDVSGGVSLGSYLDAGDASAWAVEALEWALDAGLISGRGENLLVPAGTATRAEIAQIMMNFLEKVAR